ncbi:MAG: hypothetical protein Kow0029_21720 [Candidatus Rifleibacteriota bacterium]
MRKAIIVDTDILIDLAHDEEIAIYCLKKLEKDHQLEISAITKNVKGHCKRTLMCRFLGKPLNS